MRDQNLIGTVKFLVLALNPHHIKKSYCFSVQAKKLHARVGYFLYFFIVYSTTSLHAQVNKNVNTLGFYTQKTDTIIIPHSHSCKVPFLYNFILYEQGWSLNAGYIEKESKKVPQLPEPPTPFIKVHGNIYYSFDYRSGVDTPYMQKDLQQHTVQTYLDITLKNAYPFRVYLTNRYSNSEWYKNFNDLSVNFAPDQFKSNIRQILLERMNNALSLDSLNYWKMKVDSIEKMLADIKGKLDIDNALQKEVERREALLYKKIPNGTGIDTSLHDSKYPGYLEDIIKTKIKDSLQAIQETAKRQNEGYEAYEKAMSEIEKQKKLADSLTSLAQQYHTKYKNAQECLQQKKQELAAFIQSGGSLQNIRRQLETLHISDTALPKGYKTLLAIRSACIGRSVVDYSELTVKNVSITGLQAEFNPSYYVAAAVGTVDYRFRDYIVTSHGPKQYVGVIRAGFGDKDISNIIVSYYAGRKQLYSSATTAVANITPAIVQGVSIEGNYRVLKGTMLSAEVAKSTRPYYAEKNNTVANNMSNLAYSFKIKSIIERTKTRLEGNYKYLGEGFQSFSIYATGNKQSAWYLRVDQPLFKNQLLIAASVRKNDYSNPLIDYSNQTNIVFKSLQATLRLHKWPVISLGYYPSSQVTKLGKDLYTENLFYNLVGTVNHYYKVKQFTGNSMLTYTQFYNKTNDSNFVYFNSKNIQFVQSFFLPRYTLQATVATSTNTEYNIYSAGGSMQYNFNSIISAGAGLKYNRQTVYNLHQLGYSGNILLKLRHIGDIQFMAEKSFIPGPEKRLVENIIGRATYFKTF